MYLDYGLVAILCVPGQLNKLSFLSRMLEICAPWKVCCREIVLDVEIPALDDIAAQHVSS